MSSHFRILTYDGRKYDYLDRTHEYYLDHLNKMCDGFGISLEDLGEIDRVIVGTSSYPIDEIIFKNGLWLQDGTYMDDKQNKIKLMERGIIGKEDCDQILKELNIIEKED